MKKQFIVALFLALLTASVSAHEFKTFKVNKLLQDRLELLQDRQMELSDEEGVSKELKRDINQNTIDVKRAMETNGELVSTVSYSLSEASVTQKSLTTRSVSPSEVDISDYQELIEGGMSPVFAKIVSVMGPTYEKVGSSQAQGIILRNKNFNLGSMNHSGFTWQKPMGNFAIYVNRQIAPDLFDDDRWVVTDILTIEVDAYTYLTNMKNSGMIDITKKQLGAYAGIKFKRNYRYAHFAATYNKGLTADYSKLFMSFLSFNKTNFLKMKQYEFMQKTDYLSIYAGAGGYIPIAQGASLSGGVMVQYNRVGAVSVQHVGPKDYPRTNEKFRISLEKEKGLDVEADIKLQADFFNLMRLTLFSYEYTYSYTDSDKIYLSLFKDDVAKIKAGDPIAKEIESVLKMNEPNMGVIGHLEVSRERRETENKKSHFTLFIFGSLKEGSMQQVTIAKDGITKTFFKSNYESLKYKKGFFSTLLNAVTTFFTNTELFKSYKSTRKRNINLEYEGQKELVKNDVFLDDTGKLSFTIAHSYTANETTKWYNKRYRKYAEHFVSNFTSLSSSIKNNIHKESLRGPLKINVTAWIDKNGVNYFNKMPKNGVYHHIAKICKYEKKKAKRWWYRRNRYSNSSSKEKTCYDRLVSKYKRYKKETSSHNEVSLWYLRDFLIKFNSYSDNKLDLKRLFGSSNVFYNGSLTAETNNGQEFKTYFKEGALNSLGVIDTFQNSSVAVRAPAAIDINQ